MNPHKKPLAYLYIRPKTVGRLGPVANMHMSHVTQRMSHVCERVYSAPQNMRMILLGAPEAVGPLCPLIHLRQRRFACLVVALVCVRVCEREKERECVRVCLFVCVCERESAPASPCMPRSSPGVCEREREHARARARARVAWHAVW